MIYNQSVSAWQNQFCQYRERERVRGRSECIEGRLWIDLNEGIKEREKMICGGERKGI